VRLKSFYLLINYSTNKRIYIFFSSACNCEQTGVKFSSSICDPLTGKCICKNFVQGSRCEQCKDGFYGLVGDLINGCNPCDCSPAGTLAGQEICNKKDGQCLCKDGFTDRRCSTCKPGYYGYPVSAPSECKECECNPAGSLNMTCDLSGQCFCRRNYFNRQCSSLTIGYFSASVWQLWFSSLSAVVSSPVSSFSFSFVCLLHSKIVHFSAPFYADFV